MNRPPNRTRRRRTIIFVPTAIALALAACTGPDARSVTIERSRFVDGDVTVGVGETVTFTNTDPFAHTVTSAAGAVVEFDSGELTEGAAFEIGFDAPGTHDYFCEIHPTMRATITVE